MLLCTRAARQASVRQIIAYAGVIMQGQHIAKSVEVLMLKDTVRGRLKVTIPSKSVFKSASWAELSGGNGISCGHHEDVLDFESVACSQYNDPHPCSDMQ